MNLGRKTAASDDFNVNEQAILEVQNALFGAICRPKRYGNGSTVPCTEIPYGDGLKRLKLSSP
jgi:hypothetical protein